MTDTKADALQSIGKNAFECIAEMVAALECDYDRLEELKDERDHLLAACEDDGEEDTNVAGKIAELAEWDADNGDELKELTEAAGECESREDAETRISEDPLSLEVRSGWTTLGEELQPEEFCILLSTGGPATRIVGELDEHGEPRRAWLEAQDWFTPWTQYFGGDQDTLLTYARQFCFAR